MSQLQNLETKISQLIEDAATNGNLKEKSIENEQQKQVKLSNSETAVTESNSSNSISKLKQELDDIDKEVENRKDLTTEKGEHESEFEESSPEPDPIIKSDESSSSDLTDNQKNQKTDAEDENVLENGVQLDEGWMDVLGSGVLKMLTVREGDPEERTENSNKCTIKYTCKLENTDDLVENEDNFVFYLGEGDVIQGLDVAVRMMSKNQQCNLLIQSRLAYGEKGLLPKIPPGATLFYEVELLDIQRDECVEEMSMVERQKIGEKKKDRGNWWYQRDENSMAVQCYKRALEYLDTEGTEHENLSNSQLQEILDLRLKVLNNMASAQIKIELYDLAADSLRIVLRSQPDNVKALYRRAKIYLVKQEYQHAYRLLEKAKKLDPTDCSIQKDFAFIDKIIQKQKLEEKLYAKRMFGLGDKQSDDKTDKANGVNKKSKLGTWFACGATILVALGSFAAYRIKYP